MNDFKVSFFGHRWINNLFQLEKQLVILIKKLISEKVYVSFLIGRNGEFDEYVASIIKRVQNEMGKENNELCLVLPYRVSDIEYYEKYYDNIIIPENLYGVHYKSAISLRNRWIVEQSDVVAEQDKCGRFDRALCHVVDLQASALVRRGLYTCDSIGK